MKFLNKLKEGDSILFITILLILSIVFTFFYMIFTGNANQIYNDIVLEWTSIVSANKSAEMFLIYFLSFIGLGLYGLYYFFVISNKTTTITKDKNEDYLPKFILSTIGIITLFQTLIIFDFKNYIFYALLLYSILLYIKDKNNMLNGIVFFFLNSYTIYAIYRIAVFAGLHSHLDYFVSTLISFIFSCSLLFVNNKQIIIKRIILTEQIILPSLLLIYLQNKYIHLNQISTINVFPQIKFFIGLVIICCLIEAIYLVKKYWNNEAILNKILSLGTCISIMGFNLYNNIGALVPTDLHHPFENIIGFHQIFQMGQIPFKEYIPVSGLYSVMHGFFFKLFGNGELAQYYNSENTFFLIIAIILAVLLSMHINKMSLFIFSVCYHFIHPAVYSDRLIFILPIILLLSLPKLLAKPNLWLQIWILTSLFHGLYYPVFGAAVCIGFLPLAIYQIYISGKLNCDIKHIRFWISWLLCFIPVICSTPLLLGLYTHVKAMGAQTVFADGISRFGQAFGKAFMPYLSDQVFYKLILVYLFTFIIPALFVWLAFAFALKVLNFKNKNKINFNNLKDFCLILSLAIFPLISYAYTTVRLDVGTIYARSTAVFIACIIMLIVFALKYLKIESQKYYIVGFSIFVLALSGLWGFSNNRSKLYPFYFVPNNYLYVEDSIHKIGSGWIEENTYNYIKSFNINKNYMDTFAHGPFGISYIHDLTGISVIESYTVRGYSAAKETINLFNKYDVNIGTNIDPLFNYYLYNYLVNSTKYAWDKQNRIFIPNKHLPINNKYIDISYDGLNLGKNPNSLGLSMKTLYPIFTKLNLNAQFIKSNNNYQIKFDKPIYGNDCDFLFIEFTNLKYPIKHALYNMGGIHNLDKTYKIAKYFMKKIYSYNVQIKIEWFDDNQHKHYMLADMGKGKLLIPLGSGNRWLVDNHSIINITVIKDGQEVDFPEIKTIEFLKLREVR